MKTKTPFTDSHIKLLRSGGGDDGWLPDPDPYVHARYARELEEDRDRCLEAIKVHVRDKQALVKQEVNALALLSAALPLLEDLAERTHPARDSVGYRDRVIRAKNAVRRFVDGDRQTFPILS